jgi:hypothetical protein
LVLKEELMDGFGFGKVKINKNLQDRLFSTGKNLNMLKLIKILIDVFI